MKPGKEERELSALLEPLRGTQERDPQKAALGRAQFMKQVETFATGLAAPEAVSGARSWRLKEWITSILPTAPGKERVPMFNFLAILVTIAMLFGGSGAAVYAAQASLPGEFLYPIKTVSENLLINIENDPAEQLDLSLEFSDRRMSEVSGLALRGVQIPTSTLANWQQNIEQAFWVAAGLQDAEMEAALEQIKLRLREQERVMVALQGGLPAQSQADVEQVRAMLREQLRVAENGLEDPLQFRNQFQLRLRQETSTPAGTDTLSAPQAETTSEPMNGPGPGPEAGRGPEAGPGPGAGPGSSATPGSQPGQDPKATPGPNGGQGTQGGGSATSQPGIGPGGGRQNGSPEPGAGGGSGNDSGLGAAAQPQQSSSGSGGSGGGGNGTP